MWYWGEVRWGEVFGVGFWGAVGFGCGVGLGVVGWGEVVCHVGALYKIITVLRLVFVPLYCIA